MKLEVEPEPPIAAELFGGRIGLARRFTANLAEHGEQRGLIGPSEPPRLWSRHILNCAVLAPLLNPGRVADIGSGAGLPGIVLSIVRPDISFVLVEPMERRIAWLDEQIEELGLTNVTTLRARAEEIHLDEAFDQVTARAVSALRTLIPLTAPLVKPGGRLLLMKGSGVTRERDAAAKVIGRHRLKNVEIDSLGEGVLDEVTYLFQATVG
ncbi:MAG: 16S rRNA (guanine(527)-N(7))-methyltransferase RsmG [Microbacteriaceae bacterium]